MALAWIGLGSAKPAAIVALSRPPEMPSASKDADMILFSLFNSFFFHAASSPQHVDARRAQPACG
jgi:hypothetical protein